MSILSFIENSLLGMILVRVLRIGLAVYAGLALLIAFRQRHFIYHPQRLSTEAARRMAEMQGFVPWLDAAGALIGWRRPVTAGAPAARRVLLFHGNAGHALNRTHYAMGFDAAPSEWDVMLFEYPGFGSRDGRPSEAGIYQAAEAALAALLAEDPAPLYLVGESLGGGPACYLAARQPEAVAGLWLITPFSSLVDAGRAHYPILPVRLMIRERYDNVKALQAYRGPLFVLAAERDRVVPARLARRLYDSAPTPRKQWLEQPDADHNTLDLSLGSGVWEAVVGFWLDG